MNVYTSLLSHTLNTDFILCRRQDEKPAFMDGFYKNITIKEDKIKI